MNRLVLRLAVALTFVGVLAALIVSSGTDAVDVRREPGSTTAPTGRPPASAFPPITEDQVRAVRTGNGLVLPVVGGEPGRWVVRTPCADEATVDGSPLYGANVVIDPGHGGSETGAIGPSGLTEAELNLDIAHRAAVLLSDRGADVVMTRNSDVRVTLQTRAEIATALAPTAFVSIHHNAAPPSTSASPGNEVYHQVASTESRRLAGLVWEEEQRELARFGTTWGASDHVGALARTSARTGDDYYGVLRRSHGVPSVLSEAAYISQPAEEALLRTDEFRQAEARAIADAVTRFVTTEDPGSGFLAPGRSRRRPAAVAGPPAATTRRCPEVPLS